MLSQTDWFLVSHVAILPLPKNKTVAAREPVYNSRKFIPKRESMDHMNWGRICLAIIAGAVAGSMTDWFFFGVLFHDKYLVYPEVWRKSEKGEGKQIAMSSVVGLFATAVFIILCGGLYLTAYHTTLKLAAAIWLCGVVPVIANEHIFMKLHPALFVTHSVGYLVRFVLAAFAYIAIGRM